MDLSDNELAKTHGRSLIGGKLTCTDCSDSESETCLRVVRCLCMLIYLLCMLYVICHIVIVTHKCQRDGQVAEVAVRQWSSPRRCGVCANPSDLRILSTSLNHLWGRVAVPGRTLQL